MSISKEAVFGGVNYYCDHCGATFQKRYDPSIFEPEFDDTNPDELRKFENWVARHGWACEEKDDYPS